MQAGATGLCAAPHLPGTACYQVLGHPPPSGLCRIKTLASSTNSTLGSSLLLTSLGKRRGLTGQHRAQTSQAAHPACLALLESAPAKEQHEEKQNKELGQHFKRVTSKVHHQPLSIFIQSKEQYQCSKGALWLSLP